MLTKLPAGLFYGTTTLRRDIGGLTFTESVYRDELHIPKHEQANARGTPAAFSEVLPLTRSASNPALLTFNTRCVSQF